MKIYISGQITGLLYDQVEKDFNDAKQGLLEQGFKVVSPLDNGLTKDHSWTDHMRADIKLMLDCDAIYMLKGYQDSKGAMIEYNLAKALNFTIIEQVI